MRTQLDLTMQGYVVSVPTTASTNGYDLVCDKGGRLLRIQVKSVKPNNNKITVPLVNRKNSSVAKNNRGLTHRYADIVDFIAVSVKGTNEIYYIPASMLPPTRQSETFLLPNYAGTSKKKKLSNKHRKI